MKNWLLSAFDWVGGMSSGFRRRVPLFGPLFCFSGATHKKALNKAAVLWLLGTSPILLAVVLSELPVASGAEFSIFSSEFVGAFRSKFHEFLNKDGIYVYTVSFTAPLIYMILGRIFEARKSDPDASVFSFRTVFPGYYWCCGLAVLLLIVTALSFAGSLIDTQRFAGTILFYITSGNVLSLYAISVYLWYLSILDDCNTEIGYIKENRAAERDIAMDFSKRVNREEGSK